MSKPTFSESVDAEIKRRRRAAKWARQTYVPTTRPEFKSVALATEQREWTASDLRDALYLQIDTQGSGHTVARRPKPPMTGHCTIVIGKPSVTLLGLCLELGIPIIDLSGLEFSLTRRSELLENNMLNYPEYGGDLAAFVEACRNSGAKVVWEKVRAQS